MSVDHDPALPDWLITLRRNLDDSSQVRAIAESRPRRAGRAAAVLILFSEGPAGPQLLFVERSARLRNHPGQIAFPGGSADPGDADLVATALRETTEEVGARAAGITVFGALPPAAVTVSGFDVTPVLGWWHSPERVGVVDPAEVAAVHMVPIDALVDPARRAQVRHPSGYVGPAFEIGEVLIWGLTAHLTDAVLTLGGWQRPWDHNRTVQIPSRHLADRRPDRQQVS